MPHANTPRLRLRVALMTRLLYHVFLRSVCIHYLVIYIARSIFSNLLQAPGGGGGGAFSEGGGGGGGASPDGGGGGLPAPTAP
jgi:uncharacterized membrane protein YgcG